MRSGAAPTTPRGWRFPSFIVQSFAALPAAAGNLTIPNYIESFLSGTHLASGQATLHEPSLNTFRDLWNQALAADASALQLSTPTLNLSPSWSPPAARPTITASSTPTGWPGWCATPGSTSAPRTSRTPALSSRALRFAVGNVFDIAAPDKAFDLCFVHDLFEHLSLEGMQAAIKEVCRVTRQGICVGFFNMDEIRDHQVRPVDEYHWNRLSMRRDEGAVRRVGFRGARSAHRHVSAPADRLRANPQPERLHLSPAPG